MIVETALTPRQQRAIVALLTEDSQEAAATAAKVGVRTLRRWQDEPAFAGALTREATRRLRRMTVVLCRHSEEAVRSLGRMADGTLPPNSARVRACIAIAELGARAIELEDHGARLDAIETRLAQLGAKTGGPLQ
jgi:hypothetical protein